MPRNHMSVNFDRGSIPIEYDAYGSEEYWELLDGALREAVRRGWIDEAQRERHLTHERGQHEEYVAARRVGQARVTGSGTMPSPPLPLEETEMTPELMATMTRLERLAQATGVELAAMEIEKLIKREPEASAATALIMVRGRLEVLGFAL